MRIRYEKSYWLLELKYDKHADRNLIGEGKSEDHVFFAAPPWMKVSLRLMWRNFCLSSIADTWIAKANIFFISNEGDSSLFSTPVEELSSITSVIAELSSIAPAVQLRLVTGYWFG
jgi:hypothetical protein